MFTVDKERQKHACSWPVLIINLFENNRRFIFYFEYDSNLKR